MLNLCRYRDSENNDNRFNSVQNDSNPMRINYYKQDAGADNQSS